MIIVTQIIYFTRDYQLVFFLILLFLLNQMEFLCEKSQCPIGNLVAIGSFFAFWDSRLFQAYLLFPTLYLESAIPSRIPMSLQITIQFLHYFQLHLPLWGYVIEEDMSQKSSFSVYQSCFYLPFQNIISCICRSLEQISGHNGLRANVFVILVIIAELPFLEFLNIVYSRMRLPVLLCLCHQRCETLDSINCICKKQFPYLLLFCI